MPVCAAAAAMRAASSPGSANGDAAAIVVQVMKLAHVGEASLEHLRVRERTERLKFLRFDALDELVHELAPAPEAVARAGPAAR